MTQIITGTKTEFSIDPLILDLLPEQGCVELQRDAAGKVHHFHTHAVDEILLIISGRRGRFTNRKLSTEEPSTRSRHAPRDLCERQLNEAVRTMDGRGQTSLRLRGARPIRSLRSVPWVPT
jgi:hypothetical protein